MMSLRAQSRQRGGMGVKGSEVQIFLSRPKALVFLQTVSGFLIFVLTECESLLLFMGQTSIRSAQPVRKPPHCSGQ